MKALRVLKAGVLTSLQDWGRYGQRENGLSCGGPMDEHAFLWANRLLNNKANACALELTVGLASFEALTDISIALCGADMDCQINSKPAQNWSAHQIKRADILSFRSASKGLRAYLAIAGGFQVEAVFGSCATVIREGLGGIDGQALKPQDILHSQQIIKNYSARQLPTQYRPDYNQQIDLRFIPGYQFERFDLTEQTKLLENPYTVSQRMDRMGYRLNGKAINYTGAGIISEGIALGSIQIPPDGQPIILTKDSGTIGGYPKLGCIARLDLNKLAQCQPGYQIRFIKTDLTSLSEELVQFYQFFNIPL